MNWGNKHFQKAKGLTGKGNWSNFLLLFRAPTPCDPQLAHIHLSRRKKLGFKSSPLNSDNMNQNTAASWGHFQSLQWCKPQLPAAPSISSHSQSPLAALQGCLEGWAPRVTGNILQNNPWESVCHWGHSPLNGQLIVSFLLQMLYGRGILPKPAKKQLSSSYFNTLVPFSSWDEQMQAPHIWIWNLNGTHF